MGLSDEEVERIRDEETAREEARNKVAEQARLTKTKGQKIWDYLNSAFAIWLLTSVLVAAITTGYSMWRETELKQSTDAARIKKLDGEIAYRLAYLSDDIRNAVDPELAIDKFARPPDQRVGTSEFIGVFTPQLLYELGSLLPDDEKPVVDASAEQLRQLRQVTNVSETDLPGFKNRIQEFMSHNKKRTQWNVK